MIVQSELEAACAFLRAMADGLRKNYENDPEKTPLRKAGMEVAAFALRSAAEGIENGEHLP